MSIELIEKAPEPKVDLLRDCPAGEIKGIVFWPDARLKQVSDPVEAFDEELDQLVVNMATTMYMTGGKGLAAIQLGVPKRVFIVDIFANAQPQKDMPSSQLLVVVNPVILSVEGSRPVMGMEGCLSIPGAHDMVERPNMVMLTGWSRKGERFALRCGGVLGRTVQHEYDHLDGRIFLDRMHPLTRRKAVKAARKFIDGVKKDTVRVSKRIPKKMSKRRACCRKA